MSMRASTIETFNELKRLDLGFALAYLDRSLKYIECNPAYAEMVARNSDELVGRPFLAAHPDAKGTSLYSSLRRDTGVRRVLDYSVDQNRWFEAHVSSHECGHAIVIFDVTERMTREVQNGLLAEQIFSSLGACQLGLAQLSLDGRWLGMNDYCRSILGIGLSENLGGFADISLPNHLLVDPTLFAEVIGGVRERLTSERQVVRRDGVRVWIEFKATLVRSHHGRPLFFVVTMSDIGSRKEVEESLHFALEASQMADWDYDVISDRTRRCERFDRLFGYEKPLPEWGYEDFLSRMHSEDRAQADRSFRLALAEGKNCHIECRLVWPDGSLHWISLSGRVYLDHLGRTMRMAGLVADITEERAAMERFETARLSAEDANREKSYFLANMSHEIRTPLGAILGFTDILRDSALSNAESLNYLEIIRRNGEGLAKLIDDILDLSKVEAGYLDIERSATNVIDVVEDVMGLLKVKADAKGIRLQTELDGKIPRAILSDSIRLRQMLMNIVGNAIKFTSSGGVTVRVHRGINDKIEFFIRDTGAGISNDAKDRLFQPFMQGDCSTSRKFGGTGLGLALSKKLARAMGGDLLLHDSREGEGTTFLLTLPAQEVCELKKDTVSTLTPEPPHRPSQVPELNGLKILLAEDSRDNQVLIRRLLEKRGAETAVADDGEIAVEKALHDHYDLVLMDMQMPRLDGYEATRLLREKGYEGPIVALTAHAMRHDRTKCLEAGCTDYLSKPINPQQLYRIVSEMVH